MREVNSDTKNMNPRTWRFQTSDQTKNITLYSLLSLYNELQLSSIEMPYLLATKRITVQSFGNISGRINIRNTVNICSRKSLEKEEIDHFTEL